MKQTSHNWLKSGLVRGCKIHFALLAVYIAQIIVYDAAKLITPDVVLQRWYAAAGLSAVVAAVFYLARSQSASTSSYKILVWLLLLSDIAFAAFNVYTQRGMASKAALLFAIPIVFASVLQSKAALISISVISIAAYTTAAVAYFVNYFNEGYKVELYGEILFYSALFLLLAAFVWNTIKTKRNH